MNVFLSPLKQWFEELPDLAKSIISLVILVIVIVSFAIRSVKIVPSGHVGVRKRLGRPILHYDKSLSKEKVAELKRKDREALAIGPVAIYGRPHYMPAGWNWMVPVWHGSDFIPVQYPTVALGDAVVMELKRLFGDIYRSMRVTYEKEDPYWAHYRFANLDEYLKGCVETAVTKLLREAGYDKLAVIDSRQLLVDLKAGLSEELKMVGIKLTGLHLGSSMPVPETILASATARLHEEGATERTQESGQNDQETRLGVVRELLPGMSSIVKSNHTS